MNKCCLVTAFFFVPMSNKAINLVQNNDSNLDFTLTFNFDFFGLAIKPNIPETITFTGLKYGMYNKYYSGNEEIVSIQDIVDFSELISLDRDTRSHNNIQRKCNRQKFIDAIIANKSYCDEYVNEDATGSGTYLYLTTNFCKPNESIPCSNWIVIDGVSGYATWTSYPDVLNFSKKVRAYSINSDQSQLLDKLTTEDELIFDVYWNND